MKFLSKKLNLILLVFLLQVFLFIHIVHSTTQIGTTLDLDNPIFRYEEFALNDTNTTKTIRFDENENRTEWIRIPKNSTILNTTMTFTGKITPSQTYAEGTIGFYSVAIGNVTSGSKNDIVIGAGNKLVILLNSTLDKIWDYNTTYGNTFSVDVGNVTSDTGNEIAVGSQDNLVYLLDSDGNQIWNYTTTGEVKNVRIGNITSGDGNEIAVGSDKLYVLNSTGDLNWTYTTSGTAYSVAIGDVDSDGMNDVVVSDGTRVYLLNSTGDQIWNYSVGSITYGIGIGEVSSDSGREIAVGGINKTVYLLNSTGDVKWTYDIENIVTSVSVGEITSDSNLDEIAVGSNDQKVYVLNSSGQFVWSYTTGNTVNGVVIGDVTNDPLNETATVSMDSNVYILNFDYYPTNLSLDIGNDGDYDWNYTNAIKLRSSVYVENSSLGEPIQDALDSCTSKVCNISLVLHSDASGELQISSINITYDYNVSDSISYETLNNVWSRTNDTNINESIGYVVKNVSYYSNPANDVQVDYVVINSTATTCDFGGTSYTNDTVDGTNICNITTFTINLDGSLPSSDRLWDDNMTASIAIYLNETDETTVGGEWLKNITIWNDTTTTFYGVIANTTLDDTSAISNIKLYVEWYGNGTYYDLTPSASSNDCNSANPTYETVTINGTDNFYVCQVDTNANSIIDFFKWKQPHTSTVIYKVNASTNHEPVLENETINTTSDIWGEGFNFSIDVGDADIDKVTVNFWLKVGNLGWELKASQNVTGNGTLWFNYTSNKSWTGSNQYMFEYRDLNASDYLFHGWQNTSAFDGLTVLKHNVSIILVDGNNTDVNRTGSNFTVLVIVVNDTNLNQNVSDGVNCTYWITSDGDNFIIANTTSTNSTGFCNFTFDPNASYSPGQQLWINGVYNDDYYNDQNSTNFTVNIYGDLNINLTGLIDTQNFTRGNNVTFEAKLYDENGNTVSESGYTCTWNVNNETMALISSGSSNTNSTGYCNHTWTTDCTSNIGLYPINVTLSGSANSYYYIGSSINSKNTTLKDDLNITIINPSDNSTVHRGGTVTLNSTILDGCGQVPTKSYNVSWYGTSLGNCDNNPFSGQENDTWSLNVIQCTPRTQIIIANATGDYYNSEEENVTLYIYGWAQVGITDPSSTQQINRTVIGDSYTIVCSSMDDNVTGATHNHNYPINFSYDDNLIGINLTNSSGYAIYKWNISSTILSENFYDIKCTITDNSSLYYNASTTQAVSNNVRIVGSSDNIAPVINSVTVTSAKLYSNITINANVSDVYGVDQVWVNITFPNSTTALYNLANTSTDITFTVWNRSLNFTDLGDYEFIVFANDTSGNTTNSTGWFEVYNIILFQGNTTNSVENNVSLDLTFYRNNTDSIIHHLTTNTSVGEYNFSIRKRFFDLKVKVFDHTITFYDLNATSTNIKNSLNFTNISLTLLDPPVANRGHEYAALEMSTNFTYDNATLTMNYTGGTIDYEDASSIAVYRCGDWTYSTCNSGWTEVTGRTVNTSAHTVSANITNTSAYYCFEKEICGNGLCGSGESCSSCPDDCGTCGEGGTTGGGGGGGGGATAATTTIYETPKSLFDLRTNLTEIQLDPGEQQNYALWISNNMDYELTASISVVGTVTDFITLEKNNVIVGPEAEEIISLYLLIPRGADPGSYTGEIYVSSEGKSKSLPITVTVSMKGAAYLEIDVEARSKLVGINETAKFRVMLYDLGFRKNVDVDLTYYIKDLETERIIYEEKEQKYIENSQSVIKKISMSSIDITPGSYIFEVKAKYDGTTISAMDEFEVTKSFWTTQNIYNIVSVVGFVVSIIVIIILGRRYIQWKLSKARYIFPIDFKKMPKGKLWLGKIAETNKKAYFTMDELRTHILTAGATGSGKSVSANIFIEELLEQKIPVIVFDPTAQWTGFVRPCKDPNLLKYYKDFGMRRRDVRPYNGMIYEITDPNVKIDFKKYMNLGEITVFTLNKLKPGQYDIAVNNIIDTIFAQGWEESTKLKMVVVFDEVHRLLEKYGGTGGYVALEKACREFRKWGIGLIMASQVLSDFKEAIKGNVLTEIQLHTKSLGDLGRVEKKYGVDYAKKVTKLEVGVGMIQNPRYNEGRPWFIAFRPTLHEPHKIPDRDMETYKKYAALLTDLELKIESLEKSGKDVFDLKTELKLAKDKLKKGRFRMAKIYIDSLSKHLSKG